ncbi:hypothetical protein CEXT_815581 [Caerostris extrusa]|uniref:Uncharacterized protein n=1 Tax=Caerostris extrusa TaxID=172846 RepID=A0AAV4RZK1_CAEEX|nr:hypothetical protein CEXT_815581 [Caerostris extrusa]
MTAHQIALKELHANHIAKRSARVNIKSNDTKSSYQSEIRHLSKHIKLRHFEVIRKSAILFKLSDLTCIDFSIQHIHEELDLHVSRYDDENVPEDLIDRIGDKR